MIRSQELRIGNYVNTTRNAPIDEPYAVVIDMINLSLIDNYSEAYQPIPLTDELLDRINNADVEANLSLQGAARINGMLVPKNIQYLHELQNWYYWVYGDKIELEFRIDRRRA